jgi:hypothetical protein
VNVVGNMGQGPRFIIEAHQVMLSPNPPKTCKEKRTPSARCSNIDPNMSILSREKIIISETNFVPNVPRETTVPNAMKESFVIFSASLNKHMILVINNKLKSLQEINFNTTTHYHIK